MEFYNIKSSAALIYDEFIQKAGKYQQWKTFFFNCWAATDPTASFRLTVTSCRLWQTPGRRTGSSCRPRSPKPSSSRPTSTLWRRWGPASWRTARPSTSKESWSSTTSAWWRCRSTWSTRWAALSPLAPSGHVRVFALHLSFLFCLAPFCNRRLVSNGTQLVKSTEWNFLGIQLKFSPLPAQAGRRQHSSTLVSHSSLQLSCCGREGRVCKAILDLSLVHHI